MNFFYGLTRPQLASFCETSTHILICLDFLRSQSAVKIKVTKMIDNKSSNSLGTVGPSNWEVSAQLCGTAYINHHNRVYHKTSSTDYCLTDRNRRMTKTLPIFKGIVLCTHLLVVEDTGILLPKAIYVAFSGWHMTLQ